MSTQDLLPCPFCGGEAHYVGRGYGSDSGHIISYRIKCTVCETETTECGTTDNASEAWNRRASPPAIVPDGYVLVSKEPTEEMIEAASSVVRQVLIDAAFAFREDKAKSSAMFTAEVLVSNAMANAIKAAISQILNKWQPTHRHKKRGTTYRVEGLASLQAAEPCEETAVLVIYRAEDGTLWARPHDEFHDGRFEELPAAPTEDL